MNNKKVKILLVDDDEAVRGIYTDVFQREGFEVIEAKDGVEGLDKATKEIPDVVFTGIIMPRMDGFGLKDALVKNVNTVKIPVFMLSHMGREEDRKKAYERGIKDFIIQGMITPKQVVEKVNAIFGTREYRLRFSVADLDASKLAGDLHFNQNFKCQACQEDMVMALKILDAEKHELSARFICSNCGNKKN